MLLLQRKIENLLSYIAATAIAFMMLITVADVLFRNLTPWNIPGSYSFVSLAFVFVIYLGLAHAQRENSHIAIEALYSILPRTLQMIVQFLQLSLLLCFTLLLAWYTGASAWSNYSMGDTILGAIAVETWPARAMIPIGLLALSLRFLFQLFNLITKSQLIEDCEPSHYEKV